MASAKKGNGEPGCFSAVLRHLLCRHGSSLRPTDVIGYLDSDSIAPGDSGLKEGDKDGVGVMSGSGRRAGVVARLMGLETLPDVEWVSSKSQDTFTRNRSVDLTDYLLEVDISFREARRHRHRRVSTSASFREVPVTVPTLGPEPRENNLFVVILEKCNEPTEKEIEMQGKSRKNEVQRGKEEKKTGDCQSSKQSKVSKLRDEPRNRSQDIYDKESRRTINARAACKKKCGFLYRSVGDRFVHCPQGLHRSLLLHHLYAPRQSHSHLTFKSSGSRLDIRASDSMAEQEASILNHVISHKRKLATSKRKKKKKKKDPGAVDFPEIGKRMDDVVKKAQELAGEEARNSCRLSPISSDRDEIYAVIEGQVLDGLLEEFCKDERVKGRGRVI